MRQYFLLYILVVIISAGSIYCTSDKDCISLSNTDCRTCTNVTGCAYCKNNKKCFLYRGENIINTECTISDMQYQTCIGRWKYPFFYLYR